MTTHVCRQCSSEVQETRLGRVEGEDSGIRVTIEGLPTVVCANGHKRFPTPDFPLQFIQRILASDDLVRVKPATEKGLFRKHLHCPDCSETLPGESDGASSGRAELELPDGAPATVELAIPTHRCPKCSKESTLAEATVAKAVMQACANAFRSADIPPG